MHTKSPPLGACNLAVQEVYGLLMIGLINGALALWVYYDSKSQERSGLWALGTFLVPKAFFLFRVGLGGVDKAFRQPVHKESPICQGTPGAPRGTLLG